MKNYIAIVVNLVPCTACGATIGVPCRGAYGGSMKSSVHTSRREAARSARRAKRDTAPKVVCLCGSTRFFDEFMCAYYRETMAGRIVLSVGFFPHSQKEAHGEEVGCTPEQKLALDDLHKRKIDLADEILVLDVGGYIGESMRSEIAYAALWGKPIRYLSAEARP